MNTEPILYVEDEPDYQLVVSRILKNSGFASEMASTGEEGLELLARRRPRMVILDINLPGISGFELFDRLSMYDVHPPVIFITATDEKTVRDHASQISGNVCLGKPLVGAVLLQALRAQVRRSESGRD